MATDPKTYKVVHNPAELRFEIQVGEDLAELLYQRDGDAIVFHHTFVPPALEGQGIGSQLAQAGLEYAKTNSLRVIPLCSFVESYIRRHPEYQSLAGYQK